MQNSTLSGVGGEGSLVLVISLERSQLFWPPLNLHSGDTSIQRTLALVPRVSREERFHCTSKTYEKQNYIIKDQKLPLSPKDLQIFKIFIHHSGGLNRVSRLTAQSTLFSMQAESSLVDAGPASLSDCRQFWNYSKIKLSLKENFVGSKSPLLKQKYWVTRPSLNRTAAKESVIFWFPGFSSTRFERDCVV